jgi:hypothetical protein
VSGKRAEKEWKKSGKRVEKEWKKSGKRVSRRRRSAQDQHFAAEKRLAGNKFTAPSIGGKKKWRKSLRVGHKGTAVVIIKENPCQERFQADPYGESQITNSNRRQITERDYFMKSRVIFGVFLLLPLLLFGCGKDNPLNRQSVSGKISLDGTLLPQGTIEFSPKGEGVASGASIKDGKFEIPADKGLPAGDYLVRLSASDATAELVEMPGESNKIAAELIPEKYNSKSSETFTVKAGEDNFYQLNIASSD